MGNMIYKVREDSKTHPTWTNIAVLYELNTRQFTPEGTFKAAAEHLPRLAKLGVDIIWMMPIFPIGRERRKGTLGSYYSIADYTAINEEFGTLDDFRDFVHKAHSLGLYVIVDWVANHTARDARWTREHPDWYEWDSAKGEIATPFDWSDTAKLNYNNDEMRTEMIRSMRYWLREVKIDGFRCDMAMLVPNDFWERATVELTLEMNGQERELFMLAEAEGGEFHRAFDATYAWELHHILNRISRGEADCYALGDRLSYENSILPHSAIRMQFTSNHDENSWNGSAIERMGDSAFAFTALTFLLSGMPLIYNGQECGLSRRLEFFEKDAINWSKLDSEKGSRFNALYRDLCKLKHTHPTLEAGATGGNIEGVNNNKPWQVFAVKRKIMDKIVIGIFNFSPIETEVEFYDEDFSGIYSELGSNESIELISNQHYNLGHWGFKLFYR